MASQTLTKLQTQKENVILHWTKPAQGRYVSYKEILSFALGRFGNIWATLLVAQIALGTENTLLVQSSIALNPSHVQTMNNVAIVILFFFTMARSRIIDNPKEPDKRFKRFIRFHGFPAIGLAFLLVWFPYSSLPDGGQMVGDKITTGYFMKILVVLACHIGIQWFVPLYSMASNDILMVVSPNSQERLDIQVIGLFIASLSWSISRPIQTLIASIAFPDAKDTDIRYFRLCFIPFVVIGVILYYFMYYGVKERVILARTHQANDNFFETLRSVSKNKNFWILCASGWAGFLEGNSMGLIDWSWRYQNFGLPRQASSDAKVGVLKAAIDTLNGLSATVSMLAAPVLTRRFGKRSIQIGTNLMNIVLLGITYNTYNKIPALVAFRFLNQMLNELMGSVLSPAINADVRDSQQYMTGERVDGMFGLVGYAGTFISMGTGYVTPWLQRRSGIYNGNGATDFDNNPATSPWWILKDPKVFDKFAKTMITASVIGAVANVIPLFFYDLTEKKQRSIARCLKIRAAFEDYGNGIYEPETLVEAVDIIRTAQRNGETEPQPLTKDTIEQAKALPMATSEARQQRRAQIKAAKQALAAQRLQNEDISEVHVILEELHKFDTPEMQRKILRAQAILANGYDAIFQFDEKKDATNDRELRAAHRDMIKFYPDGVVTPPDYQELERLYASQPEGRKEADEINAQIKLLEAEKSKFYHATKPYAKAKKLLTEMENYTHLEDIFAMYDQAVQDAAEQSRAAQAAADAEQAAKKAETARLNAERQLKKAQKGMRGGKK
ncbi:MAG: MFS transporter [Oscillospiraceae bacterium]|nr:MFS transporter [Oscillospiraceae bacterium]